MSTHGTETRSTHGRCRCPLCRAASALARSHRRKRNPDATRAYERAYKRAYKRQWRAARRRETRAREAAPDFVDPPHGNIYAQELADTREAERLKRERRA